MKLLFLLILNPLIVNSQTLPVVNPITSQAIICTFTVIDSTSSVTTECIQISDGTILARSVHSPQIKGTILGTGPILCLLSKTSAAPPIVNFQCTSDDDTSSGPKIVLNGILPSVTKLRKWWIFWNQLMNRLSFVLSGLCPDPLIPPILCPLCKTPTTTEPVNLVVMGDDGIFDASYILEKAYVCQNDGIVFCVKDPS